MAGQVDLLIDSVGVLFPVYKAGLVKVLAITAAKRVSELPGIPTLAEFGLGSDDLSSWYDVFARQELRRRSSPNSTAPLTRAWRFRRCELASRRWSCNPPVDPSEPSSIFSPEIANAGKRSSSALTPATVRYLCRALLWPADAADPAR